MQDDTTTLIYALGAAGLLIFLWMIRPALDSRRWRVAADLSPNGLLMAALSVGLFASFIDPRQLPILIVAVAVHEYGHVLAYRLAGHRAPVFRLVPFGGVAMSDEPSRSQPENVFVSLMGPGFSIVLIIIAVIAQYALVDVDRWGAFYAFEAMALIGLLNAFNMLPLYPLDGGQALRAIATLGGQGFARGLSLAMSAACAAVAITTQFWFLLIIAAFGLIAALQTGGRHDAVPPITPGAALLSVFAYLAVLAVHAMAAMPFILLYWTRFTAVPG